LLLFLPVGAQHFWCDGRDYFFDNLVLDAKYFGQVPVITVGPQVDAVAVDQLCGNPYPISHFSNAALQNVTGPEFPGDLPL
jgi:hypothetical protein